MNFHSTTNSYRDDRYSLILISFNLANAKNILFKNFYVATICVAFISASIANAQPKICADIHKHLIQQQQGHEPADFFVEPIYEEGGGTSYPNLDIDGDKVNDSVIRSCGAGVDSLCSLLINLSTGEQLELEEKHFFLARVKSLIYVIVGETSEKEKDKRGKRRIYQITKQAIKLICPYI